MPDLKKGDIVYGRNNLKGKHPIVYIGPHDDMSFLGVMLTKDGNRPDNIPMLPEHFDDSNEWTFRYNNTHLVQSVLFKRMKWQPFDKVGQLTKTGLAFVESKIKDTEPVFWEDYLNRTL